MLSINRINMTNWCTVSTIIDFDSQLLLPHRFILCVHFLTIAGKNSHKQVHVAVQV